MIQYLINKSGNFVIFTALSSFLVKTTLKTNQEIKSLNEERNHLKHSSTSTNKAFSKLSLLDDSLIIAINSKSKNGSLYCDNDFTQKEILATSFQLSNVPKEVARIPISPALKVTNYDFKKVEEFISCQV